MSQASVESFSFPAVSRKKLTAAVDVGRMTSDGGVLLLAAVERRIGIAHRLAALIADLSQTLVDTARDEGVSLQVQHLAVPVD